jgi:hypothetical protein
MSLGAHSTGRGPIFDRRTSASLLATSYPVSRLHPSAVPLSCDLDVSTKLANLREAQSSPKKVARSTNTASPSFRNTCPESVKGRIVSAVILSPVKCPQTHRDRTIYLFGRGDPRLPITSNPEYLYWDQSPHRFPFETSARPPPPSISTASWGPANPHSSFYLSQWLPAAEQEHPHRSLPTARLRLEFTRLEPTV